MMHSNISDPKDMTIGKIYAAKLIWESYKNVLKTEKELCKKKEVSWITFAL